MTRAAIVEQREIRVIVLIGMKAFEGNKGTSVRVRPGSVVLVSVN
jgi:hypothetical protein